jgi:Flp pilus assembly protein TadB
VIINPLTLLWLVLGALAIFDNWASYREARAARREVKQAEQEGMMFGPAKTNERYLLLTAQDRRNELGRVLTQAGLLLIGLVAWLLPVYAGVVFTVVLISIQVWLVVGARLDRRDRRRLREIVALEAAQEAQEQGESQ